MEISELNEVSNRVYKGLRLTDVGGKYLYLDAELVNYMEGYNKDGHDFSIMLKFKVSDTPFEGQSESANLGVAEEVELPTI